MMNWPTLLKGGETLGDKEHSVMATVLHEGGGPYTRCQHSAVNGLLGPTVDQQTSFFQPPNWSLHVESQIQPWNPPSPPRHVLWLYTPSSSTSPSCLPRFYTRPKDLTPFQTVGFLKTGLHMHLPSLPAVSTRHSVIP